MEIPNIGGTYHYQVESIDKVGPQDVEVLKASDHPTLTLITCYPFNYVGPAPLRFVVQASEIPPSQSGGAEQRLASELPTQVSNSGASGRVCENARTPKG
jgi:sortase A